MGTPEQTTPTTCPFIGLVHDPRSLTSYPSAANLCFRCAPQAVPALSYQDEVCLTGKHVDCAVMSGTAKTLPKDLTIKPSIPRDEITLSRRSSAFSVVAMILGAIVMLALAVGISIIAPAEQQPEWLPPPVVTRITQNSTLATANHTPQIESVGTLPPPSSTPTLIIIEPSPTPTPELVQVFIGLDTPIGSQQKVLIHRIGTGDQLILLAKYNNSAPEAIIAATYNIVMPVRIDELVVIPIDTQTWDANPALEPFQVNEDITLDKLSEILGVDTKALKYYNGCDACVFQKDSWIVIPRGP